MGVSLEEKFEGLTALHCAVLAQDARIVNTLLAAGADIQAKAAGSWNGKTPLELSIELGNEVMAALLIKCGAEPVNIAAPVSAPNEVRRAPEGIPFTIIGQEKAQTQLQSILSLVTLNDLRKKAGQQEVDITLNCVFSGNPGTGKTTVARFFANEMKNRGLLKQGHIHEVSRVDLVAGCAGQSAIKTQDAFNAAKGGVLFVDEAYSLIQDASDSYGREALDTLLKLCEDHRKECVVILAGYTDKMRVLMRENPGLESRFPHRIEFEDYSSENLKIILRDMSQKQGFTLHGDAKEVALGILEVERRGYQFSNARAVRNLLEKAILQKSQSIATQGNPGDITTLEAIHFENNSDRPTGQHKTAQQRLQDLVGLKSVKTRINELTSFLEISKKRGKNIGDMDLSLHMIFQGAPGTGKTTVARLLGEILHELEILPSGHVIETDRSSLVAGFIGQTAIKTQKAIEQAFGGVLFIDEAYALSANSPIDFGAESVNTLLKALEDHRNKFVCILAGYTAEMATFLSTNPGLASRIPNLIDFESYSINELMHIALALFQSNGVALENSAKLALAEKIEAMRLSPKFGNARDIRNLVDQTLRKQAMRLVGSGSEEETINKITLADVA